MGQRVAGICYIKVDGQQLEVEGSVEAPLAETKKETVMGLNGSAGYKETAQRQYLKVSCVLVPGFPTSTLATGTSMTVTAELANGSVYTLSGAWLEGEAAAKADEGKVELEFSGTKGTWK
jgi:hypothetical protein